MSFRTIGLDSSPFAHLHTLSDDALLARGVVRSRVEAENSAPCRISLDDAKVGEHVLLINFAHQTAETPYKQQGPIFVREVNVSADMQNTVPPALARRTLSLRGFDATHMMVEADLVEGAEAVALIERFFTNEKVAYIHAHYARRGCFAATITRA